MLGLFQFRQNVTPPEARVSGHATTKQMATTSHVTGVTSTSRAAMGGCMNIGHVRGDSCGTTISKDVTGDLTPASALVRC